MGIESNKEEEASVQEAYHSIPPVGLSPAVVASVSAHLEKLTKRGLSVKDG